MILDICIILLPTPATASNHIIQSAEPATTSSASAATFHSLLLHCIVIISQSKNIIIIIILIGDLPESQISRYWLGGVSVDNIAPNSTPTKQPQFHLSHFLPPAHNNVDENDDPLHGADMYMYWLRESINRVIPSFT